MRDLGSNVIFIWAVRTNSLCGGVCRFSMQGLLPGAVVGELGILHAWNSSCGLVLCIALCIEIT